MFYKLTVYFESKLSVCEITVSLRWQIFPTEIFWITNIYSCSEADVKNYSHSALPNYSSHVSSPTSRRSCIKWLSAHTHRIHRLFIICSTTIQFLPLCINVNEVQFKHLSSTGTFLPFIPEPLGWLHSDTQCSNREKHTSASWLFQHTFGSYSCWHRQRKCGGLPAASARHRRPKACQKRHGKLPLWHWMLRRGFLFKVAKWKKGDERISTGVL